jgi:hypothetical protein
VVVLSCSSTNCGCVVDGHHRYLRNLTLPILLIFKRERGIESKATISASIPGQTDLITTQIADTVQTVHTVQTVRAFAAITDPVRANLRELLTMRDSFAIGYCRHSQVLYQQMRVATRSYTRYPRVRRWEIGPSPNLGKARSVSTRLPSRSNASCKFGRSVRFALPARDDCRYRLPVEIGTLPFN